MRLQNLLYFLQKRIYGVKKRGGDCDEKADIMN